ncbi:MAG TPA: class I SAM-dependent methyltransferase [Bryobacteraceae bacterium]|nr:class I SAM-dependent methyltransferase [Bryobacteraceae bacterium]
MQILGTAVTEVGAAMNGALIRLGDRLGLYKAMDGAGPMTSEQLASKTGMNERYLREWLSAQAAGNLVDYDPANKTFHLTNEYALLLAHEDGPAFLPAAYEIMQAMVMDTPRLEEAFRSGEGVGWDEHHPCLFSGTERFFRPAYAAHLVTEWLPALDGVVAKLEAGAKVGDIGCGHGASTIIMAKAFPKSRFWGFDYHEGSIEAARKAAAREGVGDRCTFEIASAKVYPGTGYDLVAFFDCLHDMGDPRGASAHVRTTLKPDGTWLIVEPFAHDLLENNLNPIGRLCYCASTMLCTPASKAQEVGLALGAQAGEKRLREVVTGGGFTRFRRVTETPFNMVFEARP